MSAKQPKFLAILEFPLILREVAAIGIRLSHASPGGLRTTGETLSNTSIIYPMIEDNLGKLRITLDRRICLE